MACAWHLRLQFGTWKWYIVKQNCATKGVFSDYNGQLLVSACTGHLQVVLGELNLRSYYKRSARKWCRDLYLGPYLQQVMLLCGGVLSRFVVVRRRTENKPPQDYRTIIPAEHTSTK